MKSKSFDIKALLETIFRITNRSPNILADMYLLKDVSIISRWKNGKTVPGHDDLCKVVQFAANESTESQQLSMRKEIEVLTAQAPLDNEIKSVILNKKTFKEFLLEALSISILPDDVKEVKTDVNKVLYEEPIDRQEITGSSKGIHYTESERIDAVFFYSIENEPVVKKIDAQLKGFGIVSCLDIWSMRPGIPWHMELAERIFSIGAAIVFIGESGVSPWWDNQVNAFLKKMLKYNRPVIPVILPECKQVPSLPEFLRGIAWIDLRNDKFSAIERLASGIDWRHPFKIEDIGDSMVRGNADRVLKYLRKRFPVIGSVFASVILMLQLIPGIQNTVIRNNSAPGSATPMQVNQALVTPLPVKESTHAFKYSNVDSHSGVSDFPNEKKTANADTHISRTVNMSSSAPKTASTPTPAPRHISKSAALSTNVINSSTGKNSSASNNQTDSSKYAYSPTPSPIPRIASVTNTGNTTENFTVSVNGINNQVTVGKNIAVTKD